MASENTKKTAIIGGIALLLIAATFLIFKTTGAARRNAETNTNIARAKTGVPTDPGAIAAAAEKSKILIFREVRSWNRLQDFEEALAMLHFKFEVKPSTAMDGTDLSPYDVVIIPGAQRQTGLYSRYKDNSAKFDSYVSNGGTLVLELNGAEDEPIPIPGGVSMVKHYAADNELLLPEHPILLPLRGQPIHAQFASHAYLAGVPKDAMILAVEMTNGTPLLNRPTFIEYPYNSGRILAACQCFHSQDRSGRGPLMQTLLAYAATRQWFSPEKRP